MKESTRKTDQPFQKIQSASKLKKDILNMKLSEKKSPRFIIYVIQGKYSPWVK